MTCGLDGDCTATLAGLFDLLLAVFRCAVQFSIANILRFFDTALELTTGFDELVADELEPLGGSVADVDDEFETEAAIFGETVDEAAELESEETSSGEIVIGVLEHRAVSWGDIVNDVIDVLESRGVSSCEISNDAIDVLEPRPGSSGETVEDTADEIKPGAASSSETEDDTADELEPEAASSGETVSVTMSLRF